MTDSRKGLSAFSLKIIALILMTVDHIGYFIPGQPLVLRMIGRIAAPVFLFVAANSFLLTSNRIKYVLRLYIASLIMELTKMIAGFFFPDSRMVVTNNIFATLFYAVLIASGIDGLMNLGEKKDVKTILRYSAMTGLPLIWTIASLSRENILAFWPLRAAAPALTQVEGGLMVVVMGAGFCLLAKRRSSLILYFGVFCAFEFLSVILIAGPASLFRENIQWMMVFAIPLMLLYNNDKGKGLKWLFYVYYPLHIWILYFLGRFAFER